jgi:hypothetical protein
MAVGMLQEFQVRSATTVKNRWTEFFFEMAGKYRDFHRIVKPHAGDFHNATIFMGYPRYLRLSSAHTYYC